MNVGLRTSAQPTCFKENTANPDIKQSDSGISVWRTTGSGIFLNTRFSSSNQPAIDNFCRTRDISSASAIIFVILTRKEDYENYIFNLYKYLIYIDLSFSGNC
jgi:hypothetical protein